MSEIYFCVRSRFPAVRWVNQLPVGNQAVMGFHSLYSVFTTFKAKGHNIHSNKSPPKCIVHNIKKGLGPKGETGKGLDCAHLLVLTQQTKNIAEAIGAPLFNGNWWANTSLIQSDPLPCSFQTLTRPTMFLVWTSKFFTQCASIRKNVT